MADDFLSTLLGNPSRAKIVRAFMFAEGHPLTLGQLGKRSGSTAKNVLKEIKVLEDLGIIKRGKLSIVLPSGKSVVAKKQKEPTWLLNPNFRFAGPLSKFIHEISPVQHKNIIEALRKSGRMSAIILSGSFMGDSTRPADIIVAAEGINEARLDQAMRSLEPKLGREIRYAAFSTPEFRYRLTIQDRLIRDTLDFPHIVLLDRTRLL